MQFRNRHDESAQTERNSLRSHAGSHEAARRQAFLALALVLAALALAALVACSGTSSIAGRYSEDGGSYLELSKDGSFTLGLVGFAELTGTYTQESDGSLSFAGAAGSQYVPAQEFTATLDGGTLTINAPSLTLAQEDSGQVLVGTSAFSDFTITLSKE